MKRQSLLNTKKKKAVVFCTVQGCTNYINDGGSQILMYQFPRAKFRRQQWLELIGRPDLKGKLKPCHRVCQEHFDSSMLSQNILIPNACPNRNIPFMPEAVVKTEPVVTTTDVETPSCSYDTITDIKAETKDLEALDLEKEIAEMESSTISLIKECQQTKHERFSRSEFAGIYELWMKEVKEKYIGANDEYKNKFKLYCLNIYCKAPMSYPILKRTFSLTSVKKLKSLKINFPPGINENFIDLVGRQLQYIPKSQHVIVCIEEIDLLKHLYYDLRHDDIIGFHNIISTERHIEGAASAFVISIKGCLVNYHQMIGYCLAGTECPYEEYSTWLDDTIQNLFNAGLEVVAVLSEQTKNFELFATSLGVTVDNPFFELCNKKIYYIFDFTQTINSIRDILISHDIVYDNGKCASWEHLKILYETEKDRPIRLLPKLSLHHLNPIGGKRKSLQLARDVFSKNVAAVMAAEIDEGRLTEEAHGTVEFLVNMNNLLNVCNSTRIKHRDPTKRAFTAADDQVVFLSNILIAFENIQVINNSTQQDETDEISCFRGIMISIKAMVQIQSSVTGFKYLLTKMFHINSEEMLSKLIRNRKPPTPIQIKRTFSALALRNLMKNSTLCKYNGNLDQLVFSFSNDFSLLEMYMPNAPNSSPLAVGTTDYRFELPKYASFQAMCRYLFKKCTEIHQCERLKQYTEEIKKKNTTLKLKASILPDEFVAYIQQCDNFFLKYFDRDILKPQIGAAILVKIQFFGKNKTVFNPCSCFPMDFLNKLFIRLRIYNIIKYRNRRFNETYNIKYVHPNT